MLSFIRAFDQHVGHRRLPAEIGEQLLVNNAIGVGIVQVEPALVAVLIDRGIFRMAVRRQEMAVVGFLDPLGNRIDRIPGFVGIAVTADDPEDIVEPAIALADVSSPVACLLRPVGLEFFDPSFLRADVAEVDRRQKNLNSIFLRFANYPVGMLEVFFIGSRKITGRGKRAVSVAIHRTAKLVFDEIDDDGVESLTAARLQILSRLLLS